MIRLLQPGEFHRLASVEEGFVPPADSLALVVENGDQILGRLLLVSVAHMEGVWIKPELRGGTLMRRMTREMEREAAGRGLTKLLAFAKPDMETYIERLGYRKMPLTVWEKEL